MAHGFTRMNSENLTHQRQNHLPAGQKHLRTGVGGERDGHVLVDGVALQPLRPDQHNCQEYGGKVHLIQIGDKEGAGGGPSGGQAGPGGGLQRFGDQGLQELLLALTAAKVAVGVAGASVNQGCFAIHVLGTGGDGNGSPPVVWSGVAIVDNHFGHIHFDAAQGVNQGYESGKIHLDVAVNRRAKVVLHGLLDQFRAIAGLGNVAEIVGGVDPVGALAGDVHPQVARNREQNCLRPPGVKRGQDDGIRPHRASFTGAAIHAKNEHVQAPALPSCQRHPADQANSNTEG